MPGLQKAVVLSIAVSVLAGCSTLSQTEVTRSSQPVSQDGYVDSKQFLRTLSGGLRAFQEEGGAEKIEELLEQLSRTRCTIQLPAAAESTVIPADLYAKQKKAVLLVGTLYQCESCTRWHTGVASGFLVTSDGVMITNYHVVDKPNAGAICVMTYDGRLHHVREVLAADEGGDIAVLQLEGSGFPYVRLSPESPVGSSVWILGHPSRQFYMFTEGIVSSRLLQTKRGAKTKRISVTADFGLGSSGAPVFDEQGNVVAMVSSTRAVKATEDHGDSYAQMVLRFCIPAELMIERFAAEAKDRSE